MVPQNCFPFTSESVYRVGSFEYNNSAPVITTGWPSVTEATANQLCTDVNSHLNNSCGNVVPLLLPSEVEDCKENIRWTNDPGWGSVLNEMISRRCWFELERNTTFSGVVAQAVVGLCPYLCDNSHCTAGGCDCDPSCSSNIVDQPTIRVFQPVDGLCNSRTSPCQSVHLTGHTFINTENLTCYHQEIQVNETGYQVSGTWQESPVTFVSFSEVRCSLPASGNYMVAVSNINSTSNISNTVLHLTYDPMCYSCNIVDGSCTQKGDVCVIEGWCYLNLTLNPTDDQQICAPEVNSTTWSTRPGPCLTSPLQWTVHNSSAMAFYNLNTSTSIGSLEECQGVCSTFDGSFQCRSLDYDSSTSVCNLSPYQVADVTAYVDVGGFDSKWTYSEWQCTDDRCPGQYVEWKKWPHKMRFQQQSNNVHMGVWTVDHCQVLCDANSNCTDIVFSKSAGLCALNDLSLSNQKGDGSLYSTWEYHYRTCVDRLLPGPSVDNITLLTSFKGPGNDSFMCTFPSVVTELDVIYDVLWKVDGVQLYEDTLKDNETESMVPTQYANSLADGSVLQCAVSACYYGNCEMTRGTLVKSEPYTATIKISGGAEAMFLFEGEDPKLFTVDVTAPPYVLCRNRNLTSSNDCSVRLSTTVVSTDNNNLTCVDGTVVQQVSSRMYKRGERDPVAFCMVNITNDNWMTARYNLEVKATLDNLIDGNYSEKISLDADYFVSGSMEQAKILKMESQLTVVNRDRTGLCVSVNDPHITTFDNLHYDNMLEGEFILYHHRTLPYEVRAFYRRCNGRASCNCAVAVRAYDDIIAIDKCGPDQSNTGFYPMTVQMFRNGIPTPGLRILSFYEGREIWIIFPTGTLLIVKRSVIRGQNYLNVWLKPSSADYNNTYGLCGTLNDDISDDLTLKDGTLFSGNSERPDSFSLSWRVDPADTIYNGFCPPDDAVDVTYFHQEFCYCGETGVEVCGKGYDVFACPDSEAGADITADVNSGAYSPTKCLAGAKLQYPEFGYDPFYTVQKIEVNGRDHVLNISQVVTWPTEIGFTRQMVEIMCRSALELSAAATTCRSVQGVNYDASFESCITDIGITNDVRWSLTPVENVKEQCEIQVTRNTNLWEPRANTSHVGPPLSVLNQICLHECGGAGTCVEGNCNCNEGFAGLDCFTKLTEAPNIFSLSGNGLCDLRSALCTSVSVYSNNTLNLDTLSCHLRKIELNETSFTVMNETETIPAVFVSFNELTCTLPSVGSYEITISNNGTQALSNAAYFIVYNSLCFTCDITSKTCSPKNTSCLINDVCYEAGEYNPSNSREFCDPKVNTSQWQMANDSCEILDLTWYQYKGSDIMGIATEDVASSGDIQNCRDECLLNYGPDQICQSFTYNASSDNCTLNLKDTLSFGAETVETAESDLFEWQCQNDPCGKRGIEWQRFPGYTVNGHVTKAVEGVTLISECQRLCLTQTDFLCRSFNMQDGRCTLMNLTRSDVMTDFVRWSGFIYMEWRCTTGDDFPIVKRNPMVSVAMVPGEDANNQTLKCSFNSIKSLTSTMEYQVRWLINDVIIAKETSSNVIEDTAEFYLDRSYLKNLPFGTKLSCGVSACVQGKCNETRGAFRQSVPIMIAVQILSASTLTVKEGEEGEEIMTRLTVPPSFLCALTVSPMDCHVYIYASVNKSEGDITCSDRSTVQQLVIGSGDNIQDLSCGAVVTMNNWRRTHRIMVGAKVDGIYDGDQTRAVHISGHVLENGQVMESLEFETLEVTAVDMDHPGLCSSVNSPHITTFDGSYYTNFYEGEFVLYQHTELQYAVHVLYRRCSNQLTCNCAVAIKLLDDVFVMDRCGARKDRNTKWPFLMHYYVNGELTPGFRLQQLYGGIMYEAHLPTGTVVIVGLSDVDSLHYLQVWIEPSSTDFNKTQGLCGTFDGEKNNDLEKKDKVVYTAPGLRPDPFILSWRVPQNESLYNGIYSDVNPSRSFGSCDCGRGDNQTCSVRMDAEPCPVSQLPGYDLTADMLSMVQRPPVGSDDEDVPEALRFEFDDDFSPLVYSFPTASNITEDMARTYCQDMLTKSPVGQLCENVTGVDMGLAVESCVTDIRITDSYNLTHTMVTNVIVQCLTEVGRLVKPSETIANGICFENCNNRGTCIGGICQCQEGFGGEACRVNLAEAPEVYFLAGNGFCDLASSACTEVVAFGDTFIRSKNLTFRLREIMVSNDGTNLTLSEEMYRPGFFLTPYQAAVATPKAASYEIALSNDNSIFSNSQIFTVFHSECHVCSAPALCVAKPLTCLIDNDCFQFGQLNPDNSSQVCNPDEHYDKWSILRPYPLIRDPPVLTYTYNMSAQRFWFHCDYELPTQRNNSMFSLVWTLDGQVVETVILENNVTDSNMTQKDVDLDVFKNFTYGSKVQCGIKACYEDNCDNSSSPVKLSNTIHATITVLTESVTVTEGQREKHVKVKMEFPPFIFCNTSSMDRCGIHVMATVQETEEFVCNGMIIPQLRIQSAGASPPCGLLIAGENWNDEHEFEVQATVDNLKDGDQERRLLVTSSLNGEDFTSEVPVQVTVEDVNPSGLCSSVNDPHTTSFDGRYFNIYIEGEFIFYKHTTLPFEVSHFSI
ncbi:uncharacterized protein LOC117339037 [Pecten maximus]|uniref:uncharacterized protein LOC117339037 n=1 Tax=Pecten maximus TaxID=6579 RepID=UPI001458C2BF|nr:uncharacterized protein LOC117339037 [Pecten maximus]